MFIRAMGCKPTGAGLFDSIARLTTYLGALPVL
jgi:hypothetical protein